MEVTLINNPFLSETKILLNNKTYFYSVTAEKGDILRIM